MTACCPWLVLVLALAACSDRPVFSAGDSCSLNSDCEAPLVCRLERCRPECAGVRDCEIGSICVVDELGLGSCRLADEATCELSGDCPRPLVCRFHECTNECAVEGDEGDCLPGSVCRADGETGELGCFDPADMPCERDSDCGLPFVCAPDRRCREECVEDRDCRDGLVCVLDDVAGARVCATSP